MLELKVGGLLVYSFFVWGAFFEKGIPESVKLNRRLDASRISFLFSFSLVRLMLA